jgi:hypothetical protein
MSKSPEKRIPELREVRNIWDLSLANKILLGPQGS